MSPIVWSNLERKASDLLENIENDYSVVHA